MGYQVHFTLQVERGGFEFSKTPNSDVDKLRASKRPAKCPSVGYTTQISLTYFTKVLTLSWCKVNATFYFAFSATGSYS